MPDFNRLHVLAQAVTLLQMLSFLSATNVNWSAMPSLQWLVSAGSFVSVQGWSFLQSPALFALVFYGSLAWAALFITLFVYAAVGLSGGSIPSLWPLRLLRVIAGLTTDQLYIPILSTLLAQFSCNDLSNPTRAHWLALGFTCYAGGHLAQTPIVAVLAAGLILLCTQFALLFYDSGIVSRSVGARGHGRLDFVFLVTKTALIIFCKTFPATIGAWGVVAVLLMAGAVWASAVLWWMPYNSHFMNRLNAAAAATFLVGAVTVLIGQALPGAEIGIAFLVAAPLAAGAGVAAADWRARSVFLRPLDALASAVEVELRCRYLLHEALHGHYTEKLHTVGGGRQEAGYGPSVSRDTPPAPAMAATATAGHMPAAGRAPAAASEGVAGDSSSGPSEEAIASLRNLVSSRNAAPDDADSLLQAARGALGHDDMERIEAVYRAGCARFRAAPQLHVAMARWFVSTRLCMAGGGRAGPRVEGPRLLLAVLRQPSMPARACRVPCSRPFEATST